MTTIKQSTLGLTSQDTIFGYVAGRQGEKEIGIAHVHFFAGKCDQLIQVVNGKWQIMPATKLPIAEPS